MTHHIHPATFKCLLLIVPFLSSCNGTSTGNPAPHAPDECTSEETVLTPEDQISFSVGGTSSTVSDLLDMARSTWNGPFQWVHPQLESVPDTEVLIELAPTGEARMVEQVPEDALCHFVEVVMPGTLLIRTTDGNLNEMFDVDIAASEAHFLTAKYATTLDELSGDLNIRLEMDGETDIFFSMSSEDGLPQGSITLRNADSQEPVGRF